MTDDGFKEAGFTCGCVRASPHTCTVVRSMTSVYQKKFAMSGGLPVIFKDFAREVLLGGVDSEAHVNLLRYGRFCGVMCGM